MLIAIMVVFGSLGLLVIVPAAIVWVVKGTSTALAAVAREWFGYRPPGVALHGTSTACVLALLVLLPLKACDHWQVQLYREAIPPPFELMEVVYHDERSDLREGCGVAIFRLSEESLARIHHGGLPWLESARLGRDGTPYHHYQPWKATPAAQEEDKLFRGIHCVDGGPPLLEQARHAIRREGAFFTTGPEHDLVLVPSLGVIVFSHNG